MSEHQQLTGTQVRCDVRVVDRLLHGVGHGDHDHVRLAHGVGNVRDTEPRLLRERAALRSGREPDDHIDPALAQVLGVGVALAAVADDGDRLAVEGLRIGIVVVVHPCCHFFTASSIEPAPLAMTTAPVRTSSLMP